MIDENKLNDETSEDSDISPVERSLLDESIENSILGDDGEFKKI